MKFQFSAGLNLTCFEIPKTGFIASRHIYLNVHDPDQLASHLGLQISKKGNLSNVLMAGGGGH